MYISRRLLSLAGWSVKITAPRRDKCVICVAPHTSNLDFFLGLMAYRSLGRRANFLMKSAWFFFPLKYLLNKLGGIPVSRSHATDLTRTLTRAFSTRSYLNLAVTPEGTRSATTRWHTGFLRIASQAGVPVQLGIIDYAHKDIIIKDEFFPTGNIDADMEVVKSYFRPYAGAARYPEKFNT